MTKKNNYKIAVGLEYDDKGGAAPIIGVKGERLVADQVVKIARRFGIPVVEKQELAEALKPLDLDQEIPESLYEAVALVLSELKPKKSI